MYQDKTYSSILGIPENQIINGMNEFASEADKLKVLEELKVQLANDPVMLERIIVTFRLTPEITRAKHQEEAKKRVLPSFFVTV
jgi:hypothetical protein